MRVDRNAGARGRRDREYQARRVQDGAGRATPPASYSALLRFFHLSPRPDHAQNKTALRTEQDRPDVKRRQPDSMASRNLDPDCLVFDTATPDLDQHPAALPDGCRNGQRLRVVVPNLHSKTTTLSRVAP